MSNLEKLREKHQELKEKLVNVLSEMERIKRQLAYERTNPYVNHKWLISANAALGHRRVEHQNLLAQISSIKNQIKTEEREFGVACAQTFERMFMKVAQRELTEEQYQMLINATHIEKKITEGLAQ